MHNYTKVHRSLNFKLNDAVRSILDKSKAFVT